MSTDLETDLRAALRQHTDGVSAPPDLLARVRRGGARRRLRTRVAVAAAPVAVLAAVGGTVTALAPATGGPAPAGTVPPAGGPEPAATGTAGPTGKPQPPVHPWLPWRPEGGPAPVWTVGPRPQQAWNGALPDGDAAPRVVRMVVTQLSAQGSRQPLHSSYGGHWFVAGSTPSGRRLLAGEWRPPGGPQQAYAVVGSRYGELEWASSPVDAASAVPVRVALPRGEGWLVAAKGAELAWRSGAGDWVPGGRDAALLPRTATHVRAGDAVVPLR